MAFARNLICTLLLAMTVGTIDTSVLTDIANSIRFQAGVATLYKPREMAAAVLALDDTNAGNYQAQPCKQLRQARDHLRHELHERDLQRLADVLLGTRRAVF